MALWKTPSNQWLWRLIHIYVDLLVDIIIIIIVALKIINIIRVLHAVWLTLVCSELYVYTTELWSDVVILFVFLSRNFMKCLLTWPCWSKTRWVASSTTVDMIKLLRKVKSAHEPEGYFEHSFFSNSVRESN